MHPDRPIGSPVSDLDWPPAKEERPRSSCSAFVVLRTRTKPRPSFLRRPLFQGTTHDALGQPLFGRRLTAAEDTFMALAFGLLVVVGVMTAMWWLPVLLTEPW